MLYIFECAFRVPTVQCLCSCQIYIFVTEHMTAVTVVYCCANMKQQSTVPIHKLTCNMRSIEFSHADRQSLYSYLFIFQYSVFCIFACGSTYSIYHGSCREQFYANWINNERYKCQDFYDKILVYLNHMKAIFLC